MATLRIDVKGQTFEAPLPDAPVRIGRGEDMDLRLAIDGIGVEQCVLDPLPDGRFRLRDSGSGHPTRVNGAAVKQVSLDPGDVIEVGAARLTFIRTPAAKGVPAKPIAAVPATPAGPKASAVPAAPAHAVAAAAQPGDARPATRATENNATAPRGTEGAGRRRAQAGRGTFVLPLVAIMIAAAVGVFVMKGQGGDDGLGDAQNLDYAAAMRRLDAKDWDGARAAFEPLAQQTANRKLQDRAVRRLRAIEGRSKSMHVELEALLAEGLTYGPTDLATRRRYFAAEYGEQWLPRFTVLLVEIQQSQVAWRENVAETLADEAKLYMAAGRFDQALANWRRLRRTAPAAIDVTAIVDAGMVAVETSAAGAADRVVAQTARMRRLQTAEMALHWLEKRVPGFAGTKSEVRLAGERKTLRALVAAKVAAKPTPAVGTPAEPSNPTVPGTPTQSAAPDAVLAANQALAAATVRIASRDFQSALDLIRAAHAKAPAGSPKASLAGRLEDLTLAQQAFTSLVADIKANGKQKYRRVPITDRLKASIVDADTELLSTIVRGGQSKFRWSKATQALLTTLFDRAAFSGDDALAGAGLLHVIGAADAAGRALLHAGQTGVDTARIFPLMARWRGEEVPTGGYVVHAGAYVTPTRRDFLILEARISAAMAQIGSRKLDDRKAAYAELLAIGEPAAARLERALSQRREAIVDEIASNKAFRSTKHKNKLFALIKQRRQHALSLIRDAQAYPYPNPGKKNQKEVEARVDKVSEVWDRPFDLIAAWDKGLRKELERVTEVDEVLVQLDPGYRPDLAVIKDRINLAIDMPGYAPSGKEAGNLEYSLKVLSYNERIKLTATEQEKDNTRAVNEYRMMMGLRAVKIHERLLRAARGHSRHMRENKYFAHNVPANKGATAQNRTPGARMKQQGYGGGGSENIAMGAGTGRGAFGQWFRSSGHHRNMLGGWSEMGCGRCGRYWTQNFGRAGGNSLSEPETLPEPKPHFAPEPEASPARRGRLPGGSGEDGLFRPEDE